MGTVEKGIFDFVGKLPGEKQSNGEMPVPVLERMLQRELGLARSSAPFSCTDRQIYFEHSRRYSVQSKYYRTIQHADLVSPDDMDQETNNPIYMGDVLHFGISR